MQNLVFPEYEGLFGVVTKSKIEVIMNPQMMEAYVTRQENDQSSLQ